MHIMGSNDKGRVELVFVHVQKAVKVFLVGRGLQSEAVKTLGEGIVGFIGRITYDRYNGCILLEEHPVQMVQRHPTAANHRNAYTAVRGIEHIANLSNGQENLELRYCISDFGQMQYLREGL